MTAGLSKQQKQAMLDAARPTLLRILGPNCLGLLSPHLGLNASFSHADALPGQVAFVSQSGALVTAVLDWASARRIGFSHMVSLGEHADVDFGDLLDHLASDCPHAIDPAVYRIDRGAVQIHVGSPRSGAQQAGHRRQGRARRQGHGGSGLAYRRAGRRRYRLRCGVPARRHVARRYAAGSVHGRRNAGPLRLQPRYQR